MTGSNDDPKILRVDDVLWATPTDNEMIKDVYLILSAAVSIKLKDAGVD